jgi:hypothetical protein
MIPRFHVDIFKQKGRVKKIPKVSWKYLNSLNISGLFNFGSDERIDTSNMVSHRKGIYGKEK